MDGIKKILYISYDGLTDPLGQSQVLPYLKELSRKGYRFTVLSFEKKNRLEKERSIIEEISKKAGINWVPLSFSSNPPILSKIWDRFRMWKTALRLHRLHHFDLVHCRSYVAAEVGLKLKRLHQVPFLFDMRGFWADEKVDNGQWNLKSPFFRWVYQQYKKKEKQFLLNADCIVLLTTVAKDYLKQQALYKNLNIMVIPCCADLDHFNYNVVNLVDVAAQRKKLGLSDTDKVITYLGSVGGWYMTKEMFAFFKLLKEKDSRYKMLFLTKDDAQKVINEGKEQGILKNDLIVTYSDRKSLPIFLALSQCSIFFIRNSFSKKASSPTKHGELMGMGIPVVCNDIGDLGKIITSTETGILVDPFDHISMQDAVEKVSDFEKSDRQQIREAAFDFFDLKEGCEKYAVIYSQILYNSAIHSS
jgi:glycosyltransferase involved in cell wall biosynthesis